MMTKLKDYLEELNKLIENHPEALDYYVIYSHDDEGNEYQGVIYGPSLCAIEETDGYRELELIENQKHLMLYY